MQSLVVIIFSSTPRSLGYLALKFLSLACTHLIPQVLPVPKSLKFEIQSPLYVKHRTVCFFQLLSYKLHLFVRCFCLTPVPAVSTSLWAISTSCCAASASLQVVYASSCTDSSSPITWSTPVTTATF